jgi:hypothetical protein
MSCRSFESPGCSASPPSGGWRGGSLALDRGTHDARRDGERPARACLRARASARPPDHDHQDCRRAISRPRRRADRRFLVLPAEPHLRRAAYRLRGGSDPPGGGRRCSRPTSSVRDQVPALVLAAGRDGAELEHRFAPRGWFGLPGAPGDAVPPALLDTGRCQPVNLQTPALAGVPHVRQQASRIERAGYRLRDPVRRVSDLDVRVGGLRQLT